MTNVDARIPSIICLAALAKNAEKYVEEMADRSSSNVDTPNQVPSYSIQSMNATLITRNKSDPPSSCEFPGYNHPPSLSSIRRNSLSWGDKISLGVGALGCEMMPVGTRIIECDQKKKAFVTSHRLHRSFIVRSFSSISSWAGTSESIFFLRHIP